MVLVNLLLERSMAVLFLGELVENFQRRKLLSEVARRHSVHMSSFPLKAN